MVAASRQGAKVCLIERYPYLGGLASGGMVLVLDDMCAGSEITVRGICGEMVDRLHARGLAVYPPEEERGHDPAMYRKWSRWGLFDFNTRTKPHPICYAVAFDPDGWKRASDDMVVEAGIDLRLHSTFAGTIVEDGRAKGVIVESKQGREAIFGEVVIDATGDLHVAASAGAAYVPIERFDVCLATDFGNRCRRDGLFGKRRAPLGGRRAAAMAAAGRRCRARRGPGLCHDWGEPGQAHAVNLLQASRKSLK